MPFIIICLITVVISCIFSLLFCYRAIHTYEYFEAKGLYYLAFLLFAILIPFINIVVSLYYMANLFENFNIKKQYKNNY